MNSTYEDVSSKPQWKLRGLIMYRPALLLHLLGATGRVCHMQIIHSYRQNTSFARADGSLRLVRGQRGKKRARESCRER